MRAPLMDWLRFAHVLFSFSVDILSDSFISPCYKSKSLLCLYNAFTILESCSKFNMNISDESDFCSKLMLYFNFENIACFSFLNCPFSLLVLNNIKFIVSCKSRTGQLVNVNPEYISPHTLMNVVMILAPKFQMSIVCYIYIVSHASIFHF